MLYGLVNTLLMLREMLREMFSKFVIAFIEDILRYPNSLKDTLYMSITHYTYTSPSETAEKQAFHQSREM